MAELFENLKCSQCKRYLSVLPIKVYHNRPVTCGRCNSENDGGTISTLYESVAQKIEFPCANHYEGCRERLLPKDIISHEKTCKSSVIYCPLCSFEGHSLELVVHIKQAHPNFFLNTPVFYISFDCSNEEEEYVYASESNSTLIEISSRYDSVENRLYLYFYSICKANERIMGVKFNLYSMDNHVFFKSKYEEWNPKDDLEPCSSYEIFIDNYRNLKAICRFFIADDILNMDSSIEEELRDHSILLKDRSEKLLDYTKKETDPKKTRELCTACESFLSSKSFKIILPSTKIIKFVCNDVRSLKSRRISPPFYVLNTCWNMTLENNFMYGRSHLGFSLNKEKDSDGNKRSYKVDFKLIILTVQGRIYNMTVKQDKTFGKRRNESLKWECDDFISFDDLLNPKNEFMNILEDNIQFVLQLTIKEVIEHRPTSK